MKLVRDIFYQQVSVVLAAILALILHIILGRFGRAQLYGQFSFIMAVMSFYAIIMDGGFKTLIYRESINKDIPDIKKNAFSYLLLTFLAGLFIFYFIFNNILLTFFVLLFFGMFVFSNMILAEIKGKGEFFKEGLLNIIFKSAQLISVLVIIKTLSPQNIFLAMSTATLFCFLILSTKLNLKTWIKGLQIDVNILKLAFPFIVIDFLTSIYFRIDIVFIKYFLDDVSVGMYASAYKFIEGVILIFTPVTIVLFRKFRQKHVENKNKKILLMVSLIMAECFSLICILFFYIFGEDIIKLTFGNEYLYAANVLFILAFSLLFIFPNGFLTQLFIACDKERYYALAVIMVTLINVIMNILLLPVYGVLGAAYATIVSELSLFVFLTVKLKGFM